MFLLDTNVWIVYLRGKDAQLRSRIASHNAADIAICSIVLGELQYGALRSAKPVDNSKAVDAMIAPYVCFPFDEAAAGIFAEVRVHLEAAGTPIGPYDMQIAAIALVNQCTVVTHNVGEFSRVSGLAIEDWQTP